MQQKFLFLISASPWNARARAMLDFLMTAAVLDQEVHLCFWGEGVTHLLPEQDGASLELKAIAQQLPALELYGVSKIYAEREMIERLNLDVRNLAFPVTAIDHDVLQQLQSSCDVVEHCR